MAPLAPAVSADEVSSIHLAALHALPADVAILDDRGLILAVNAAWSASEANNDDGNRSGVGKNYLEICEQAVADDDESEFADVVAGLRDILPGKTDAFFAEYASHTAKERRWFVLRASRFSTELGMRVVLLRQDTTARRLAEQDARLRSRLLDEVDAAVIALDADGLVTTWNRGAEVLYGWTADEVLGCSAAALITPGPESVEAAYAMSRLRRRGRWEGEQDVQRKDGARFRAYVRNVTLVGHDGRALGYVGVSIDITERLQRERDLRSARDYMRAVAECMGDGLCTVDERGRIVYLNPKAEKLLGWTTAELAGEPAHERLHHLRPDGSPLSASECRIVQARRSGQEVRIDDDVLVRRDGSLMPVSQILRQFESDDGESGFVLVFSDMSERARQARDADRLAQDRAWIDRIRHAVDHERFVLYAQPIVDLATGTTAQHELLIRLVEEDGSIIPPDVFLPVAESYGLIGEIDRWVIRQGVGLAAAGNAVEVNVSAHTLSDHGFYDYVDAELTSSGADPALLIFELTETALLGDEEAALRFMTAIARRGCGLALDDFGTGYGGFSYLKRLPVDYLKIDIEFVRDLASEPASRKVVEAVVNLARDFGIKTVAEGVEGPEALALLREYGVDYAQGYAIGHPVPLEQAIKVAT
jgi:PAS domain S-box-containing protein